MKKGSLPLTKYVHALHKPSANYKAAFTSLAIKGSSLSLKRHLQETVMYMYSKISYGGTLIMRASRNSHLLRTIDVQSVVPRSLHYGFVGVFPICNIMFIAWEGD